MFQDYHGLLVFLITLVVGFLGMGITQWFKIQLQIADKLALVLTVAVSLVLAVGELFLTGVISGESFQIAAIPGTLSAIFSLATIFYKLLIAGPVNDGMVADRANG